MNVKYNEMECNTTMDISTITPLSVTCRDRFIMFFTHFHQLLSIKTLIIVGTVSIVTTILLMFTSDDLHHKDEVSAKNLKFPDIARHSEDDKKMFHWMKDDNLIVKMAINETKKGGGVDGDKFLLFQQDTRPPLTAARIAKYCNSPNSQEVGKEGLVSKDYKLVSVHVAIRHGDRSPISRLPNAASHGLTLTCHMDTSQYSHLPKVTNFVHVMAAAGHQMSRDAHFSKWALYPSQDNCADGQLTGLGSIQHVLYGMHYSDRYQQQHKLFDETNWHTRVVAHTTMVSRTYQSAISFLYGLLPNFDLQKLNLMGSNNINFCEEATFGSACTCFGLEFLRGKAGQECRTDPNYREVMRTYQDAVDYVQDVLALEPADISFPAALMDGLSSYACHSLPAPCNNKGMCITAKTLETIWEPVDFQSTCLHNNEHYKKYTKAYIHGLLYRIAQKMNAAINNKTTQKFHLYSGHDTTLSPLITALELEDGVWPGYASRITFELYQQISTSEHMIRILQNGKVVTSEALFCRNKTEDGFCKFINFYDSVTALNLPEICNSASSARLNSVLRG